jgi:hypothetical protein
MSVRCASLILLVVLAGCQTTGAGGTVHPQLPDIPPEARAACARPTAHVGDDLGVLAARWKATAVCEGGKRASIIVYYDTIKEGFAK